MANKNSRQLNTFELVEHFLVNALDVDLKKKNYNLVPRIVTTELNIDNFDEKQTTNRSKAYRNLFFRNDKERTELKVKIINELLTKQRLQSDDKIIFGKGGAIPKNTIQQENQAYIVIGLPASGKSSISNEIADRFGCIILDSDYAKRKLPEYNSLPFGATLVHEESIEIIFGEDSVNGYKSLLQLASDFNINLVIPKIGNSDSSIMNLVKTLKKYNYSCHLTLVELDRKKATQRALDRFIKTKRYVPLGLIFDGYSNNPTITYHKLKRDFSSEFSTFGIVSTDVNKGARPVKFETEKGNPAENY